MASERDIRAEAPLVTFVSAAGGVGKSTLALMCAWLSAKSGLSSALFEGDLQFGDFGSWLGVDAGIPGLEQAPGCEGVRVSDRLSLYKAPLFPEFAEDLSDRVAAFIPQVRQEHELVFADTGQFWSGLTGDLVCASDLVVVVFDGRSSSVTGAIRAQELLARLGVPMSRCVYVCNKWSKRSRLGKKDLQDALRCDSLCCVADGKANVDVLLASGEVTELVDAGNALVQGVDALLGSLLTRVGCAYTSQSARRTRGLLS